MYKHYISQIEYIKELIEDSISLQEETKYFIEDGKLINAYNNIKEMQSKLTSIRFRIEGMDVDIKRDKEYVEPIRNSIIDELVYSEDYAEYSRDWLSDLTDMSLVQELYNSLGPLKLHAVLKQSSISNQ